jgi:predicted acetyltransferase
VDVALQVVAEDDKAVLANLVQLYRHDLSEFRHYPLTEHGTFVYRFLDHYFFDDGREACFVRAGGELAGFVMSRPLEDGAREVAEFFVVRKWRRRGVGSAAAEAMFRRHPGRWSVSYDDANPTADAFWPGVVASVASGTAERARKPATASYPGTELRFAVAGVVSSS